MHRSSSLPSTGANVGGDANNGQASNDSGYGTGTKSNLLNQSGDVQYPSEDDLTQYHQRARDRRGEIAPRSTFPIHERAGRQSVTPSALSVSTANGAEVDSSPTLSTFGEDGQPSRDRQSSFSKSGASISERNEQKAMN